MILKNYEGRDASPVEIGETAGGIPRSIEQIRQLSLCKLREIPRVPIWALHFDGCVFRPSLHHDSIDYSKYSQRY